MASGFSTFDLFGSRLSERQMNFDITLLPMNLSDGRNIGELPGLFLFKAPKKAESSRQADIFFVLFSIENVQVTEPKMNTWANILADSYYASRGSFTMGMTSAVKKLAAWLEKDKSGPIAPIIYMNAAVLRDRSLMIAHAGPVHTTVISSDHVQNYSNDACLPIQMSQNELSFFTADIHSEDIILLCPHVPADWTNSAIMEVTGDSPLNAIRFLLDRSNGDLQAAVIQLKSGKGEITFRSKKSITANVQPENIISDEPAPLRRRPSSSNSWGQYPISQDEQPAEKPLLRQRKTAELFTEKKNIAEKHQEELQQESSLPETIQEGEADTSSNNNTAPDNPGELSVQQPEEKTETGAHEFPGSQDLPFDFYEPPAEKKQVSAQIKKEKTDKKPVKTSPIKIQAAQKNRGKFNFRRFGLILICGLLIPVIVVSVLFLIYSGRSKDQLHREYLSLAVTAAQKALTDPSAQNKESLWTESLGYVNQALTYGNSPAAVDLRKQAMNEIDRINGGIATIYNYANQTKLPQGLNLVEIASSGQYTYALDATSGSVLRFVASGSGLALDNNFNCGPGIYNDLGTEDSTIKVGPLIDFVILPSGNPHSFVLSGIDAGANVLYCSGFTGNRASALKKPEAGRLTVKGITFSNNALYVLDTQASAVWEYLYSNADGFIYEPSNFYGSYSPYLSDVIDFTMYKEYTFFLRENGTLLMCDYTGYRPDCHSITEIENADGTAHIGLANHRFTKILLNNSPDNSIYIMDGKMQTVLNISAKANFIRYIVPNRTFDEISQYSNASGFGITGQNRLLWGYQNDLYIGNMP